MSMFSACSSVSLSGVLFCQSAINVVLSVSSKCRFSPFVRHVAVSMFSACSSVSLSGVLFCQSSVNVVLSVSS